MSTSVSTSAVVASSLLRSARWFLWGILAIQVLVVIAVAIGNGIVSDDEITQAVWEFPGVVWIRYPLFGIGVAAGAATMTPFIANGVTRREYLAGTARYAGVVCAAVAVMGALGYWLERAVYVVADWEVDIADHSPIRLLVTYVLLYTSYIVSGAMVGAGFARWEPKPAAWMITPFLFPLVVSEVALSTWWGGLSNDDRPALEPLPFGFAVPVVVAVIAAGAWIAHRLLRDVAIRPKKG